RSSPPPAGDSQSQAEGRPSGISDRRGNTSLAGAGRTFWREFFGGAEPARSHKEDLHHVGIIDYGGVRAGKGGVCGHRLGRSEEFLAAAPCRLPAAGAGGTGQHARSRRSLGGRVAAAFQWPAHCRDFGAVPRGAGLHAGQVPTPGPVSGTSHDSGPISGNVLPFGSQGRSERHRVVAGSVTAPSRAPTPTAAGYHGNPAVAVP